MHQLQEVTIPCTNVLVHPVRQDQEKWKFIWKQTVQLLQEFLQQLRDMVRRRASLQWPYYHSHWTHTSTKFLTPFSYWEKLDMTMMNTPVSKVTSHMRSPLNNSFFTSPLRSKTGLLLPLKRSLKSNPAGRKDGTISHEEITVLVFHRNPVTCITGI